HAWKRKFGGMEVSEAKRLRALEEENSRLKRLVADQAADSHWRSRPFTSSPEALGRTDTLRAFMTNCAMNASTANSSAICTKRASSWKAGASNIMSVDRTVRFAIGPR